MPVKRPLGITARCLLPLKRPAVRQRMARAAAWEVATSQYLALRSDRGSCCRMASPGEIKCASGTMAATRCLIYGLT